MKLRLMLAALVVSAVVHPAWSVHPGEDIMLQNAVAEGSRIVASHESQSMMQFWCRTREATCAVLPEALQWQPHPMPEMKGAYVAVVLGNPRLKERYKTYLRLPARFRLGAHYHTTDEEVTVMKGKVKLGFAKTFGEGSVLEIPATGFILIKKDAPHWAWTDEEAVILVEGEGPLQTIFYPGEASGVEPGS